MLVVSFHLFEFSFDHIFDLSDICIKIFLQDFDDPFNNVEVVKSRLLLSLCDLFEEFGMHIHEILKDAVVWSLVQLIVLDYR